MLDAAVECWTDPQYWKELHDWMLDCEHEYLPVVEAVLANTFYIAYDEYAATQTHLRNSVWDLFADEYSAKLEHQSGDVFFSFKVEEILPGTRQEYKDAVREFTDCVRYSYPSLDALMQHALEYLNARSRTAVLE